MSQSLGDLQAQWYAEDTGGTVGSTAGGGYATWINTASELLASQQKPAQPAGTQSAPVNKSGATQKSMFNTSGWTVATSGSKASGGASKWLVFMAGAILARFLVKK